MNDYTPEPIEVSESAVPSHVMSTVRDLLGYGTAWAIGQGWIDTETGTQVTGFAVIAFVYIWRQYVTSRTHSKLVTSAAAAPNDIARIK